MSVFGRARGLFRVGAQLSRLGTTQIVARRTAAQYRQPPHVPKNLKLQAEFLSGAMWFWILWNFWHDPDAVLGHFPWPDTDAWTDEELGIPPDDEE